LAESHAPTGEEVRQFALALGAEIVGFASPATWDEVDEVPADFRPRSLFPLTETVIVMGIAIPLPIIETTPSAWYMEAYNTANRQLDDMAYRVTRHLNSKGHPSVFFPRDGYGSIEILVQRPLAAFSHRAAAVYAGLGTVGLCHSVLTPQAGPRMRFVSVLTSLLLAAGRPRDKDLCIKCLACAQCCPVDALKPRDDRIVADYDVVICAKQAQYLTRKRRYPCGICIKVCPIGEDRRLYRSRGYLPKYRRESELLESDPDNPAYRSWTHVRKYGSWPYKEKGALSGDEGDV